MTGRNWFNCNLPNAEFGRMNKRRNAAPLKSALKIRISSFVHLSKFCVWEGTLETVCSTFRNLRSHEPRKKCSSRKIMLSRWLFSRDWP
jgi:hypothetical protein